MRLLLSGILATAISFSYKGFGEEKESKRVIVTKRKKTKFGCAQALDSGITSAKYLVFKGSDSTVIYLKDVILAGSKGSLPGLFKLVEIVSSPVPTPQATIVFNPDEVTWLRTDSSIFQRIQEELARFADPVEGILPPRAVDHHDRVNKILALEARIVQLEKSLRLSNEKMQEILNQAIAKLNTPKGGAVIRDFSTPETARLEVKRWIEELQLEMQQVMAETHLNQTRTGSMVRLHLPRLNSQNPDYSASTTLFFNVDYDVRSFFSQTRKGFKGVDSAQKFLVTSVVNSIATVLFADYSIIRIEPESVLATFARPQFVSPKEELPRRPTIH